MNLISRVNILIVSKMNSVPTTFNLLVVLLTFNNKKATRNLCKRDNMLLIIASSSLSYTKACCSYCISFPVKTVTYS